MAQAEPVGTVGLVGHGPVEAVGRGAAREPHVGFTHRLCIHKY